ncbi:MAG: sugar ABC transporter ATP-binding protein [Spirochaetales bacterium]|nr:sugar ABC transporter ATP-binding protein [Spirochaetales bacterium]
MVKDKCILKMEGISKSFPGVKALNNVQFALEAGEVHVLMGENGAGKSTLMKVLAGIYTKDEGSIDLKGREVDFHHPSDSIHAGISMIHQELMPIPHLAVAENIYLGREPLTFVGTVDRKKLESWTTSLFEKLRIEINPWSLMNDLSVAEMQMVEIAKATSWDSDIIIMDEPTSAITEQEVDNLFRIIRQLKAEGTGIIYISHKMDEIFEIGDRITVFRDGEYVDTCRIEGLERSRLISLMVGREIKDIFPKTDCPIGETILKVDEISLPDVFENLSFELKKGEILGISGLMGAGRTELVETLFGIRKKSRGTIFKEGKEIRIEKPSDAIENGLAIVSEDRKEVGLVLKMSVGRNLTLTTLKDYALFGQIMQERSESKSIQEQIEKLIIKTAGDGQLVSTLSGGNQQKVVIGKWLLNNPDILIMDEPTRGIDVAAKAEIHKLICRLACQGKGIILISSELPEIIGMCDRVLVMHEGRITGELDRKDFTQECIMHMATGQCLEE